MPLPAKIDLRVHPLEPLSVRYALITDNLDLRATFEAAISIPFSPRYNIAPTQWVPVVRMNGRCREILLMRWDHLPLWPLETQTSANTDTVIAHPDYQMPLQCARCLVPATGFYVWATTLAQEPGQSFLVHRRRGGLIAFAGIWKSWRHGETTINAFNILETGANIWIRQLTERMPVILGPEEWEEWLDPETEPDRIEALQVPCPAACLDGYPVSHYLNDPDHDDPKCIRKVALESLGVV